MSQVLGALVGGLAALGLVVAYTGVVGVSVRERRPPVLDWGRHRARLGIAIAALTLGWAATGWPAAGGLAAAAGFVIPGLIEARRARARSLALTEGLAGWAEMLRDTIASHAGLREAIGVTAEVAPEPVRPAVRRLAARAEHDSLSHGLARFADEVRDPVGDLIVAALAVAADGQARNLPALLSGIAAAARAEARMRMQVETGRARTYSSSRALVAITLTMSCSLLIFAPRFMAPYQTLWGQVVLLGIGGLFTAALVGLVALGRPVTSPRLLAGVTERLGAER